MKKYITLVAFILTCIATYGQNEAPKKGNEAYKNGDYSSAIESFESLIGGDQESAELYFNLGNSYFYSEDIGRSVLYYEKAKRLDYHNPLINTALQAATKKVQSRITIIPDFFLVRWFRASVNTLSSSAWRIVQIIGFLGFLIILYMILFKNRLQTKFYLLLGLLSSLTLLSVYFGYMKYQYERGGDYAIVLEADAALYESADERSGLITTLSPGVKVQVLIQIGDWYKVILADKDIGWIETKRVEII